MISDVQFFFKWLSLILLLFWDQSHLCATVRTGVIAIFLMPIWGALDKNLHCRVWYICIYMAVMLVFLNISANSSKIITKLSAFFQIGLPSLSKLFICLHVHACMHSTWKHARTLGNVHTPISVPNDLGFWWNLVRSSRRYQVWTKKKLGMKRACKCMWCA